ncbi:cyclic nucleotide-binding domain-containing protein [Leptospira santarosai]|uniref:cyclic nucleotide-binding domain-containing protein n=1 Tax=Leptospira santarosai TaxID=28183 RepID=UPI000773719D|nr:cyclic nucleotide-binding domain-containing protein [Leptospira santarosai]MDI7185886.1 cyclic nucleotide-binding domain-containing protein [Leptospira santarosai]MDI7188341.1 cyclic nucleotide-binding domain-containing protein [Leptospira santarosai]MDI7199748.1 cyclic nucleotide-binding domain-containing protein [Leptospira santarosai]MDI7210558.1 cyclic nucleotide-binding domain-containing protein [Leptospira santarosai]MDI7213838.1 cyclic nucleotide-binding domain-containing protein [Le
MRILWDVVIFVCILYASVESPLRIVLSYEQGFTVNGLYILVDLLYFGDILYYIFSPEFVKGRRVYIQKKNILRYLRTWFFFDFIAAFPFELVAQRILEIDLTSHPYLFLLFGITRIVKVVRVPAILHRLNLAFKPAPGVLRLVLLGFWISIVAHWCAVGWLYMDELNSAKTGWDEYVKALYWSVMTLATVGYGDVLPVTTNQRIYVILVMMLGAAVYATVIGNIASILGNLDLIRAAQLKRMSQVDSYLRARNLPYLIRRKIRDYYMYIMERGFGENEKELLSDLPLSLQREVKIHLHRELLEKVPFLKGAEAALVTTLVFSLKHHIFLPGDIIFRKGDIGHNLYILSEGKVEILSKNDAEVIATLSEGQFFGEFALVTEEPRSATVRSVGISELYTLSKEDFLRVLNLYPGFKNAMRESLKMLRVRIDSQRPKKSSKKFPKGRRKN